jgi:hypothetical protein
VECYAPDKEQQVGVSPIELAVRPKGKDMSEQDLGIDPRILLPLCLEVRSAQGLSFGKMYLLQLASQGFLEEDQSSPGTINLSSSCLAK